MQSRRFEFDPIKSGGNLAKHGISLERAYLLWDDPDLLVLPSKFPDEPRCLAIGIMNGKHWTTVFTERIGHVRLISVRRSRDEERQNYEKAKIRYDR
jgi:uncharacterized protein